MLADIFAAQKINTISSSLFFFYFYYFSLLLEAQHKAAFQGNLEIVSATTGFIISSCFTRLIPYVQKSVSEAICVSNGTAFLLFFIYI